ncbi:hypothetical protein Mal4_10680 [Maioricimonas rarisocia]|uniref:Uncharacterized protein n=1 Tax=Maioricimonas rarisocia TaxID=2528026 RepID=A0A517Z2Q8_9PLAN|nr:hypothetical protein Mal4_10680 [Maioricimonas rarisocia]
MSIMWMEREYPPFRIGYVSICLGYVALSVVMCLLVQFVIPTPADWGQRTGC